MTQKTSQAPLETRAVRACQAATLFERSADRVILAVRRAMGVPDQAEPEVEQEFAALRATFDQQYFADFERMYAALLTQQLGSATTVVLDALETEPAQAYLAVAQQIDADVGALLPEYLAALGTLLRAPTNSDR